MPLLLLLLALVVLGAVALVAAGRGDPLVPGAGARAHDRAPLVLPPAAEPVAPEDVDAVRFALAFRGYRVDEVDAVLDRLADEIAVRDARLAQLEERLAEADRREDPAPPDAG